ITCTGVSSSTSVMFAAVPRSTTACTISRLRSDPFRIDRDWGLGSITRILRTARLSCFVVLCALASAMVPSCAGGLRLKLPSGVPRSCRSWCLCLVPTRHAHGFLRQCQFVITDRLEMENRNASRCAKYGERLNEIHRFPEDNVGNVAK